MKFLLILHSDPAVWDGLSEADRAAHADGHDRFRALVRDAGELVDAETLADPAQTSVTRVEGDRTYVTDGSFLGGRVQIAGYYLVDCENRARAQELAALVPDAAVKGLGVEVRPVMSASGTEM